MLLTRHADGRFECTLSGRFGNFENSKALGPKRKKTAVQNSCGIRVDQFLIERK